MFITLKNFEEHLKMKKGIAMVTHSLILVYLFGFLTAGNWAGHAINTYPKVGDDWFIKPKHFNKDVSTLQNFTENKLIVQWIH